MEKKSNFEYGQTDPDFIDQNTLIDGSTIHNNEQNPHELNKEQTTEFGESDPDYIDQNTLVDNDNYARDEDPYQYQEEFVEDLSHPENDFEKNENSKPENDDSQKSKNKDPLVNPEKDLEGDNE
ncbi:hypothetical protein AAEO57_12125 [Flavobacterium sp. DGU38]|uniref:Highly acidic protein n=1 Tax=Flavobacterium calami TaxID=3139144 RepID=A0ABU9IS79_9FLAO